MQADNEQAPRAKHARRGISDTARVYPQHLQSVCPGRPCAQEGTALVPWGRVRPGLQLPRGNNHRAQPLPRTPNPWSSPQLRGELSPLPVNVRPWVWDRRTLALLWLRSHVGWNTGNSCFQRFSGHWMERELLLPSHSQALD